VLKVSNGQRRCKEETWPPSQVAWPAGLTSGPHTPILLPEHRLTPPINTTVLPTTASVKKVRFSPPQGASKFNLCIIEREARFWGPKDFLACWESSEYLKHRSSTGSHSGSTEFSELWFGRVRKLCSNSANFNREPTLESLWCIGILACRDTYDITLE
jgi:hypothetical protein